MDALDVISVASAKNWLIVDDGVDDNAIAQLIKAAIDWIETYTCYRLYYRIETIYTRQIPGYNSADYFPPTGSGEWAGPTGITATPTGVSIYLYPVTIIGIVDKDGNPAPFTTVLNPLKLLVYAAPNCTIDIGIGYLDVLKIPQSLVSAAYKLITYLYNNRDMYPTDLPTDLQMLLNQYRRAII